MNPAFIGQLQRQGGQIGRLFGGEELLQLRRNRGAQLRDRAILDRLRAVMTQHGIGFDGLFPQSQAVKSVLPHGRAQ